MTDSGYQYFNLSELACKGEDCCGGKASMHQEFMPKIVSLRRELGFPFAISSAYRCPLHNSRVSSTGDSGPHTTGRAIDILASYEKAYDFLESAIQSGNFTGFGISQKGDPAQRFIHLDDIPGKKRIWTY